MDGIRELFRCPQAFGDRAVTPAQRKKKTDDFVKGVGEGLRRAARDARKIARMYGTPIYVIENGKIVAKKP